MPSPPPWRPKRTADGTHPFSAKLPPDGETIRRNFNRFVSKAAKRKSWFNTAFLVTACEFAGADEYDQVSYESIAADRIRLGLNGIERNFSIHRIGDTSYVDSSLGSSTLVELPRFPLPKVEAIPGSLIAPLPGVVNEIRVSQGDSVAAGDVVLVIDSMKVFHWISAPLAGRVVEIRVERGNHVEAGTVLAVIEDA